MAKLSPHYREDSSGGLSPSWREYLDKEYFSQLPHLEVVNPRLLVVFAGGNAVGKTTLSSKIAKELHGIHLENDAVRRTILKKEPNIDREKEIPRITWQYTLGLYSRLERLTGNGLVIRDGVITWYYDKILPIFKRRGYDLFIVAYELSESKILELIRQRGDTALFTTSRLEKQMEDHKIHLRRFLGAYRPDITLTDDTLFDHGIAIAKIREKIANLKNL